MYLSSLGQVRCWVFGCLHFMPGPQLTLYGKTKNLYFYVLVQPGPGKVLGFWFARTSVDMIGPLASWRRLFFENLSKYYTQCIHFKEKN